MKKTNEERAIEFDSCTVQPGCVVHVRLATFEYPIPGTGVPGFPETRAVEYRVSHRWFQPTWIDIDGDCVEHFSVHYMLVGQKFQWLKGRDAGAPASIFASKPPIEFDEMPPFSIPVLQVRNDSSEPRDFRARLWGYDLDKQEDQKVVAKIVRPKKKNKRKAR